MRTELILLQYIFVVVFPLLFIVALLLCFKRD